MDYKKSKAPTNTVTHNLMDFCEGTDNSYESVAIMSKRANQISAQMKEDLSRKLKEFATANDNLEETFEKPRTNRDFPLLREVAEAHADGCRRVPPQEYLLPQSCQGEGKLG